LLNAENEEEDEKDSDGATAAWITVVGGEPNAD
jgi:hypothetical protein